MLRRLTAPAILLLLLFDVLTAHAREATVNLPNTVGCQSEDNIRWLMQMAVDGSTEAIAGFDSTAFAAGECVHFRVGQSLFVVAEDTVQIDLTVAVDQIAAVYKFSHGAVPVAQVTRLGNKTAYWMLRGALQTR